MQHRSLVNGLRQKQGIITDCLQKQSGNTPVEAEIKKPTPLEINQKK